MARWQAEMRHAGGKEEGKSRQRKTSGGDHGRRRSDSRKTITGVEEDGHAQEEEGRRALALSRDGSRDRATLCGNPSEQILLRCFYH
jgi:hypothetical protein